ncbi:thioesterase [Mycolicibacterium duvalii]|uniref:Thioesterase TesA n=1 Tax=Mycolicibacterium duvalii TaxID=39688 RepID=A0A7I7K749_9MYCO|nr:alpha/beta fold hydrolase [Mycolicibacterium duvalii]MCV7368191.1 thioesterase [Mycolicibacterium duvalii]PEG43331.1 thioesterase [Mycolicibacterium duvalii]BBX19847.1 thioesterase [Mycolicibacterium duvalii]
MTTPSERSRWIRNFTPAPNARTRLVCFPHAGGSASYYFPLSRALSPEVDVYAVQYPGRQDRHSEPFIETIDELADRVYEVLGDLTDAPVAFFGHSMGAVLAFEVTRRLEQAGRGPSVVFVSGSRAPHRYEDDGSARTDAGLIDVMRDLGGTDPRVLGDQDLLETFLPPFRNDFRALAAYNAPGTGVRAPLVVMTATDDPKTSEEDARAWDAHTSGPVEVHTFTGGHFYLEKQAPRVIEVIARTLRTVG